MKNSAFSVPYALRYVVVFVTVLVLTLSGTGIASAASNGQANLVPSTFAPVTPLRPVLSSTYKWIDVNLTKQLLVAYQGNRAVFSTLISSGVAKHKTAVGTFHIYAKLTSQRMTGGVGVEHYDLPNVPYVMYFYGGNAIHGTYWHHNFGHPMSHGCVNAPTSAAAYLFKWAPMGTTVRVHY